MTRLTEAVAFPRLGLNLYSDARARARLRAVALPAAVLLLAIFVRTYQPDIVAWHPDAYERLADVERILAGKLPESKIYGPGASILLAPAMAIFGASLETMRGVVAAGGIALVALAYFWVMRLTNDRGAAALFAAAVAISPMFVYGSRVAGLFDVLTTLLIALAVFVGPLLRKTSPAVLVVYGLLLALLVSVRPTNIIALPALLIYFAVHFGGFPPPRALRELISAPVLIAGTSFVLFSLALALTGGWSRSFSASPFALERVLPNLLYYTLFITHAPVLPLFIVPLTLVGARRLSRLDRPLLLGAAWIIVAWPLAHAPLSFSGARYMLPSLFFVLLLCALGGADLLRAAHALVPSKVARKRLTIYTSLGLLLLGLYSLMSVYVILSDWPKMAAASDEGQAQVVRPLVAELPHQSVIVSAVTRTIRGSNTQIEYFDLVDYTVARRNDPDGLANLSAEIDRRLAAGKNAYYLLSHAEAGYDLLGDGRENYYRYFETVQGQFTVREVHRTSAKRLGYAVWILYKLEPKAAPTE